MPGKRSSNSCLHALFGTLERHHHHMLCRYIKFDSCQSSCLMMSAADGTFYHPGSVHLPLLAGIAGQVLLAATCLLTQLALPAVCSLCPRTGSLSLRA